MKKILLSLTLLFLIIGCGNGSKGQKKIIRIWHPWGPYQENFEKLSRIYMKSHPDVIIKYEFVSYEAGITSSKLLTAVTAGEPPEISYIDGSVISSWAHRDALVSLDDMVKEAGIERKDFYLPSWDQNMYNGKLWGLPFCTDANFALFWNKKHFIEAGLDPDKPPKTIKELTSYANKLTIKKENGQIERIGFMPWQIGGANSIFTWGWVFGGEFYDEPAKKFTATHPKIVEALEWMMSFVEINGQVSIQNFSQTLGSQDMDPFYIGKLSMEMRYYGEINNLKKYAPDIDFGVALLPFPKGGRKNFSWIGGWCMAIPRNAKHQKEAFAYLNWLNCTEEGSSTMYRVVREFIPAYKNESVNKAIIKEPRAKIFLEMLENSSHVRPRLPAQTYMMDELQKSIDEAIMVGEKSAAYYLERANKVIQKELDEIFNK